MLLDLKMALALINKMELKKGGVPADSNEPIVTATMKETATHPCLCKKKPCNCVHGNIVNGHPIAISLANFPFPSDPDVLNHFALQALFARQYNNSELYAAPPWSASTPFSDAPQVVSSSDQVVRRRIPPSRTRKKDKKESASPVSPVPLSPPVSTSSPVEKDGSQDNQSRSNSRLMVRGRKYVCNMCQRSFDYKHVLQNHERTHTGEKPFECSMCQKKFTRDHHLKTHMRLHTGEKPYKCTHCDKDFVQVANLRRHIKVHEPPKSPKEARAEAKPAPMQPPKPRMCQRFLPLGDICTTSSVIVGPPQDKPEDLSIKKKRPIGGVVTVDSNAQILTTIEETVPGQCHCQQKPCDCLRATMVNGHPIAINCSNYSFPSLQALYALPEPYNGAELYPAAASPTERLEATRFDEKERSSSPPARGRKYTCRVCKKAFDYKHVLTNHERTHTGEKPYQCNECDRRFTRDHHLKTHLRLHTGEKPYKCDHCGKRFVQVANLRRHIRVHTGERPYACDFASCKSRFADTNQLNAHRLTHKSSKSRGAKLGKEVLTSPKAQPCRYSRVGDICTLAARMIIDPPQDQPEDLSIKNKKHWSVNNNNSSGSADDSCGSTSPASSYF